MIFSFSFYGCDAHQITDLEPGVVESLGTPFPGIHNQDGCLKWVGQIRLGCRNQDVGYIIRSQFHLWEGKTFTQNYLREAHRVRLEFDSFWCYFTTYAGFNAWLIAQGREPLPFPF